MPPEPPPHAHYCNRHLPFRPFPLPPRSSAKGPSHPHSLSTGAPRRHHHRCPEEELSHRSAVTLHGLLRKAGSCALTPGPRYPPGLHSLPWPSLSCPREHQGITAAFLQARSPVRPRHARTRPSHTAWPRRTVSFITEICTVLGMARVTLLTSALCSGPRVSPTCQGLAPASALRTGDQVRAQKGGHGPEPPSLALRPPRGTRPLRRVLLCAVLGQRSPRPQGQATRSRGLWSHEAE